MNPKWKIPGLGGANPINPQEKPLTPFHRRYDQSQSQDSMEQTSKKFVFLARDEPEGAEKTKE